MHGLCAGTNAQAFRYPIMSSAGTPFHHGQQMQHSTQGYNMKSDKSFDYDARHSSFKILHACHDLRVGTGRLADVIGKIRFIDYEEVKTLARNPIPFNRVQHVELLVLERKSTAGDP